MIILVDFLFCVIVVVGWLVGWVIRVSEFFLGFSCVSVRLRLLCVILGVVKLVLVVLILGVNDLKFFRVVGI